MFVELDFRIVYRPVIYYEAADAVSRLLQKATTKTKRIADPNDDIQAYCVVWQRGKLNTIPEEYGDEVGTSASTRKLTEAQADGALSRDLEEVLRKNGTGTVNDGGLLRRKVPIDETIQIAVPEYYKRTLVYYRRYSTLAGLLGIRRKYDVLRRTFYWLHMTSITHELVFRCESYRRHRPSRKHQ